MKNTKEINIKYRTYYFFNDMINSKDFDSNLLKIDKKSYKNIYIYYIGYITMKDSDYVNINSVNTFYLIIVKVDGYIVEKNGEKIFNFGFYRQKQSSINKIRRALGWD